MCVVCVYVVHACVVCMYIVCPCVVCGCVLGVCMFNHSNVMYLYLIIVLICNFVVTDHVEHFFMYLFAIHLAFFKILVYFGNVLQLSKSQFPDRGSNPGHSSESPGWYPGDHQQTPHVAF